MHWGPETSSTEISLTIVYTQYIHQKFEYRSQIKNRLKSGAQKSEIQILCKSSTSLYNNVLQQYLS